VTTYVPDTVGSVIQTLDASGSQTSSTAYWPFGEVQTGTGTNLSPWGFIGSFGYYQDSVAKFYVRARVLRGDLARWQTVDKNWPVESAYGYATNNPLDIIDKNGEATDPCAPGGSDRRHPKNDCKKCGAGCKPVYFTCNAQKKGKHLAVYCDSDKSLGMGCNYQTFCQYNCCKPKPGQSPVRPPLPPPAFPIGSSVCIHGQNGTIPRKIDDCGCGQHAGNLPVPNNWMDYEGTDCSDFKDGWRCVCPGSC
jgi:RHS repeat-associated protein